MKTWPTSKFSRDETGYSYVKTTVDLGNLVLTVTTNKALDRTVKTIMRAAHKQGEHFIMYTSTDYYRLLSQSNPSRVTEKTLREQHDSVLAETDLNFYINLMKSYYENSSN